MDRRKALLLLKQKMKEQVPDQWLYSPQVNKLRQRKWRHKKWNKALLNDFCRPSFFEGFYPLKEFSKDLKLAKDEDAEVYYVLE